jgi:hypothetical protein
MEFFPRFLWIPFIHLCSFQIFLLVAWLRHRWGSVKGKGREVVTVWIGVIWLGIGSTQRGKFDSWATLSRLKKYSYGFKSSQRLCWIRTVLNRWLLFKLSEDWSRSRSHVTIDGQSVCQGIEPTLGLVTRYYFLSEGCCLKIAVLSLWGALSDERPGLSFVTVQQFIYNIYKVSFSPVSVQQIMVC